MKLRQSVDCTRCIGPFLSVNDGVSPLTSLDSQSGQAIKNDGQVQSFKPLSWVHAAEGHYSVGIPASVINQLDSLRLLWSLPKVYAPVWVDYIIEILIKGTVIDSTYPLVLTLNVAGLPSLPGPNAWSGQLATRCATGERRFIEQHIVRDKETHIIILETPFANDLVAGEVVKIM